jgi:hypothetical protein
MEMYWLADRKRVAPAAVRKEACEMMMGMGRLRMLRESRSSGELSTAMG